MPKALSKMNSLYEPLEVRTSRDFEKCLEVRASPLGILKWDPAPDLQTQPNL